MSGVQFYGQCLVQNATFNMTSNRSSVCDVEQDSSTQQRARYRTAADRLAGQNVVILLQKFAPLASSLLPSPPWQLCVFRRVLTLYLPTMALPANMLQQIADANAKEEEPVGGIKVGTKCHSVVTRVLTGGRHARVVFRASTNGSCKTSLSSLSHLPLPRYGALEVSLWDADDRAFPTHTCLMQVVTKAKDWVWIIGSTAVVVVLPIMLEVRFLSKVIYATCCGITPCGCHCADGA